MPGTAIMWNFMKKIGPSDPKYGTMQKGCYHTFHPFFAPPLSFPDKQFSYMKAGTSPSVFSCNNYSTTRTEENSSRPPVTNPPMTNIPCSKKKKKKRKRKKKKSNKNNQTKCTESMPERQRTVSIAESEDSFVIFFEGEEEERTSEVSENETETTEEFGSSDCFIPNKKVRFAVGSQLCEIHPMIQWSYAYQAARKGPWEEYARDRDRFRKRVANTEALIGHVFATEHRSQIYKERFASDD